ncbi:efflux RND transporter periplasmic adaptor subunit [Desulfovibrio sp. OttesenSCG-928-G11]|nr:efflux RND transporter periplasmic adaptor subunit [Desulfovibrio sp. OttesenSCG-928-G11]
MHPATKFSVAAPLLLTLALLSGCGESEQAAQSLPEVSYITVDTRSVTLTTELSGRTSSFTVSEVRPQVSGIIQQRLFTEGADVKQGEVLYQIDPALYQAAYDNAKATLEKAEANEVAARLLAERYEKVVKVNAVSKQEYDNAVAAHGQARAEVSAAKAALDTAAINLNYTRVTSPVSGRIGRSTVTPGALVTQNQAEALATVQQLDPMYVDVTQSSSELLRLKRDYVSGRLKSSGEGALRATLLLEDGSLYKQRGHKKDPRSGEPLFNEDGSPIYEPVPVTGLLKFSEVTVEQSTGVVTIRAVFPNPDNTLLPGMYVRAILEEGVKDNAVLIPQKAVVRNNRGLPTARVLSKNATLENQPDVYNCSTVILTIDRPIGSEWLVTDGLKKGDLLLVDGIQKVLAGKPVKAVPADAPAQTPANAAPAQTPANATKAP